MNECYGDIYTGDGFGLTAGIKTSSLISCSVDWSRNLVGNVT